MRRNPIMAIVVVTGLVIASCATQQGGSGQGNERSTPEKAAPAVDQPGGATGGNTVTTLLGDWSGTIVAAGQTIPVRLRFIESGGAPKGTIDIPEQHAFGLPLVQIDFAPPAVSFLLHAGSDIARFKGKVEKDRMWGSFSQGPVAGTFSVTRSREGAVPAAPGAAGGPAEGEGTPIELTTPSGALFGTLDLPSGRGPFPVALIIAGSGPTDRNGNSPLLPGKNNALLMVARALREHGIASVRYDKRGVGESAAALRSETSLTFSDYIEDAAAWIDLLKHDPRFTKVGVIGDSEGSLVGMVAARIAGADAFVSIGGAGMPAGELLKNQLSVQPQPLRSEAFSIIDALEGGQVVAEIPNELRSLFRASVQPYLISWFRYDPRKEIAQLTIPVLILQGSNDLQVSAKNAEELHAAQPRSTLDIIQGMNHVLKMAPNNRSENIATYSDPNLPLAPMLVKALANFFGSVL